MLFKELTLLNDFLINGDQQESSLLDRRWKEIKTAMYGLTTSHDKFELILSLIRLREDHTAAPTLSEITNFTGYDVAIKTIQGWEWEKTPGSQSLDADANEIGKYGAELMVIHSIRECLRNGLLTWDYQDLVETEQGQVHFTSLNSFNVDITGSRMDIAKKRFMQSRLTKAQRHMDPVNKIPVVRQLYWENSILMLLRAPLPFYQAMAILSEVEQDYILSLHSKLVSKSKQDSSGIVRVRLTKNSMAVKVLSKLAPPTDTSDRRPRFVACLQDPAYKDPEKVEYHLGLGALTMFTMFLLGFDRDHLDEKATRAENAVKQVIEHSGHWKVVDSNTEVIMGDGEVITEIDIIAQSLRDRGVWTTFEVKDFSFWKGWIFGHGIDARREYYLKAIAKLPIKEEYIQEKHDCEAINSVIVTSIPEPYSELEDIPLIYLSDMYEELAKMTSNDYTPRKRHQSSNFLTRYYERLMNDYKSADDLNKPMDGIRTQIQVLRKELTTIKGEYQSVKDTYSGIVSEHDTLIVSEKLASKRLLMDTGEKHYQLEEELKQIRVKISKIKRDRKVKASILKELKGKYNEKLEQIKGKEKELEKVQKSHDRLLVPRLF